MTPTHLFTSVLLALVPPLAPAQGDGGQRSGSAPDTVIPHANAFPEATLACVALRATRPNLDALSQHAMVAALLHRMGSQGLTAAALDTRLQEATGQGLTQWLAVLHGGVTWGLTEVTDSGEARWLMVADVQDQASTMASMLDRARQAPGAGAAVTGDGAVRTWVIATPLGRIAFSVDNNHLVASNSATSVTEALARLRTPPTSGTLATTAAFANLDLAASVQPNRFLSALVRPNLLCERALAALPNAIVTKVRGVLRALDITRISGGGITIALDGNDFVESYYLDWPAPRNGPLAELIAPKATLRTEVAALIPADVASFTASAVDLQRVFQSSMRLFGELLPREADQVQARLTQWTEQLGFNLQDDLLGRLGSQVVTLQWGADETEQTAAIVQLTDAAQFDRTLRRVLGSANPTMREESVSGYGALIFSGGEQNIALTVTEDSLIVASSTPALQRVLEQLAAPRGTATMSRIPAGVSAFGVTRLGPLLAQMETVLTKRLGNVATVTSEARATLRAVRDLVGDSTLETSSARDERSVTVQTRSPLGGVLAIGAWIGSTTALPEFFKHSEQNVGLVRTQSALPATLLRIVRAERTFQTENPGTPAPTLGQLVTAGQLTQADVGTAIDDVVFELDGYRISILRGTEAEANAFIAVAWPANARTGPVFAATPDHPALVNDVMAGAAGLSTVNLADIYTKGFGSPMRSGWRVVQPTAVSALTTRTETTSTESSGSESANAPSGKLATAVAALEQGKGDRATTLTLLRAALASDNAARVGYAAHALGRLRVTEEVPALVALVAKHQDVTVRTLAMWALLQFADPRSKQTSIETLGSDSVELRALAAANLGKLRATDAAPALLGLLAKGQDDDERDRAVALLALTDLGDPAPLLQAAAAVIDGQPTTLQALAFAFQTLSPKLAPKDEANMLVAVLDHAQPILRRYAIQRLGELRERTTGRALEERLGHETRELLPLVQVSLQAVRGDTNQESRPIGATLSALWMRARTSWNALAPNQRYAAMGGVAAFVLLVALISVLRRSKRTRAQGNAWAAMAATAPETDDDTSQDEVDLSVGESGVYSPHDHDQDSLLRSETGQFSGSHR